MSIKHSKDWSDCDLFAMAKGADQKVCGKCVFSDHSGCIKGIRKTCTKDTPACYEFKLRYEVK